MKVTYISFRDYTALPFLKELNRLGAETEYVAIPTSHRMILGSLEALTIPRDSLVILESQAAWFAYALKSRLSFAKYGYLVRLEGDPFTEAAEVSKPFRTAWELVLRTGLGEATGIIHVSEYLKREIARRIPGAPHRVVHNGVDIQTFSPGMGSEVEFSKLAGPKDNKLALVTLMNFDISRKLEAFADAAEPLSKLASSFDYRLLLVGDGAYRKSVARIFKNLKNVEFVGAIPRAAVARVLPLFDVFFYPSSLDAYPNSILEASASGLPILATSTGGIPEQVEHEKTGLLMTDLRTQLYPYMKRLLEDSKLRSAYGRSARKKAESEFDWKINCAEFARNVLELTDFGRGGTDRSQSRLPFGG